MNRLLIAVGFLILSVLCACSRDEPKAFPKVEGDVSYVLEDGEAYHAANPATFEIPSLERRQGLKPGEIVKLMFRISNGSDSLVERMWVIVEERTASGYVGRLDNDPACTDRIRAGMKVKFEPRHVINVFVEDAHPELKPANPSPGSTSGLAPGRGSP